MGFGRVAAVVALVVSASTLRAADASSCSRAEDCNLNGACVNGVCACIPTWRGEDCGQLNLQPAKAPDGALYRRANTSSWCAGVVQSDDGRWHAYVAVMALHCGLNSWQRNSIIVHAESESMAGPYVNDSQVRISTSVPLDECTVARAVLSHAVGCHDGDVSGAVDWHREEPVAHACASARKKTGSSVWVYNRAAALFSSAPVRHVGRNWGTGSGVEQADEVHRTAAHTFPSPLPCPGR